MSNKLFKLLEMNWNMQLSHIFPPNKPLLFEMRFTFPTIKMHRFLSVLSEPCQHSDLPLPVAGTWTCLWTRQSFKNNTTGRHAFLSAPLLVSLSSCISLYSIYPFCDADRAPLPRPPQSVGSFGVTQKWLHFVTQWVACLLASAAVN